MITETTHCRICGSTELALIVDLGHQALTGVFPKSTSQPITSGPLELVKCANGCGLVQLRQSYDTSEMYGANYGYRSGLNRSMVEHLHELVARVTQTVTLGAGDLVVDIGSNDGTLLGAYDTPAARVGIDPSGAKFRQYYKPGIDLIPEFFSAKAIDTHTGGKKAKVISSIAMFYDLESPISFMEQVRDTLADDGIWLFEQSYMPTMLEMTAYDTICHEHLEYYGLSQIKWMTDRVGLQILDVWLNNVNGGSFAVIAGKANGPLSPTPEAAARIAELLRNEEVMTTLAPFKAFETRIFEHRDRLIEFIHGTNRAGQRILGYGASTKGNVILQFCKLTATDIPAIAEVNEDKFGAFTPGTHIPIISEREARASKPDYFLVLPWHFRQAIIERESAYLASGGKLLFPLPAIEAHSA
jgi:NDP-4-keto-2,6-dideoxyhexose 3-C-methyltransferase